MKKIISLIAIAALTIGLTASVSFAGNAAGMASSPHDLSGQAWTGGTICGVCHTPHNIPDPTQPLLWNHGTISTGFTLYSSITPGATVPGQPDGASKLCLGCHDGTVALDDFGGATGGSVSISAAVKIPATSLNLSGNHPVSVVYNGASVGLYPTGAPFAGGTIADILDTAGKVQCSSCHDVHDDPAEAEPGTPLLRVLNTAPNASGLCLSCHNK